MKKRIIAIAVGVVLFAATLIFSKVFLVRTIEEVFEEEPYNVSLGEVTNISGIELGGSIFSVDESAAAEAVKAAYPDNSVAITDIERVFPNKVIIYAKERIPVLMLESEDELSGYKVTDMDFQINKTISKEEAQDADYIKVTGVKVAHSYNFTSFKTIRKALLVVTEYVPDYSLTSVVESIDYSESAIKFNFKNGSSATYTGDAEAFATELNAIL